MTTLWAIVFGISISLVGVCVVFAAMSFVFGSDIPDKFRLDIGRVVEIDGNEFVINSFQADGGFRFNDCERLTIDFVKMEDWARQQRRAS